MTCHLRKSTWETHFPGRLANKYPECAPPELRPRAFVVELSAAGGRKTTCDVTRSERCKMVVD